MPCSATSSAKQKKRLQRSTIKGLPPLKRYLNAWSRHHRSGGFGIHSPYAYRFVRQVWRQPLPYYAYAGIRQLQTTIKSATTREQRRKLDLISYKEARLLFRVANFFNPARILQVGAATGVESVAMLEVSRRSRLFLYDAQLEQKALAVRVLRTQMDRVACYDDVEVAADEFLQPVEGQVSLMALVNIPIDEAVLTRLLDCGVVLVMRNLLRDASLRALYDACCAHMPKGQTYTNDKIAILNPNPKLQREDFLLWL